MLAWSDGGSDGTQPGAAVGGTRARGEMERDGRERGLQGRGEEEEADMRRRAKGSIRKLFARDQRDAKTSEGHACADRAVSPGVLKRKKGNFG